MTTAAMAEELARLRKSLTARDKTIDALVARVEGMQSQPDSPFALLERNLSLERQVASRTAELVEQRQRLEVALLDLKSAQSQKLLAIGQLAAGIAHEINTPTQFVSDNAAFLETAFQKLHAVIESLRPFAERDPDAQQVLARARLDYLGAQVPRALAQSFEGLDRIKRIVMAMKEFSHPSAGVKAPVAVDDAIRTTIEVARNEWKYVADVETDFDPELEPVPCLRDELNQALLNLIVNAAHAIGDATDGGRTGKGLIKITTRKNGAWADIAVADTGSGIAPEIRHRVFEPYFTTKPVGQGTGQGLAIVYSVVVDKHGGRISLDSELGVGTTFLIELPRGLEAEGTP